jgi:hypothetical protein
MPTLHLLSLTLAFYIALCVSLFAVIPNRCPCRHVEFTFTSPQSRWDVSRTRTFLLTVNRAPLTQQPHLPSLTPGKIFLPNLTPRALFPLSLALSTLQRFVQKQVDGQQHVIPT